MTHDPAAEQRRQQQAILDEAPANIYVKDLQGRYLFVNAGVTARMGLSRQSFLGRTDEEIFGAEQAAEWRGNDARALDGKVEEIEFVGDPVTAAYRSLKFPLRGDDGRTYAVCGISLDVTDAYRAEQARGAAERRLAQLESIESLGRFAGGMAHDLKNALTAVQALVEVALEDAAQLSGASADRLVEVLGEARTAVQRSTDQIARLMTATLPMPVRSVPLRLEDLFERVRPLLRGAAGAGRLRERVPAGLPTLLADADDVERILVNLVSNAADAVGTDGTVLVAAAAATVELPIDDEPAGPDLAPGRYVRIDVVDDGTGMPPDVLDRAMQPLFTTKPGGSGLGLWSAHALALRAGGALSLASTAGEGSTATLWLPTAPG